MSFANSNFILENFMFTYELLHLSQLYISLFNGVCFCYKLFSMLYVICNFIFYNFSRTLLVSYIAFVLAHYFYCLMELDFAISSVHFISHLQLKCYNFLATLL